MPKGFKTGAFNRSATHPRGFFSPRLAAASTRLPGPPACQRGDFGCRLAARKMRRLVGRFKGNSSETREIHASKMAIGIRSDNEDGR